MLYFVFFVASHISATSSSVGFPSRHKPTPTGYDEIYDDVLNTLASLQPYFSYRALKCAPSTADAMNDSLVGMSHIIPSEVQEFLKTKKRDFASFAILIESYFNQGTREIYAMLESSNEYEASLMQVVESYTRWNHSILSIFGKVEDISRNYSKLQIVALGFSDELLHISKKLKGNQPIPTFQTLSNKFTAAQVLLGTVIQNLGDKLVVSKYLFTLTYSILDVIRATDRQISDPELEELARFILGFDDLRNEIISRLSLTYEELSFPKIPHSTVVEEPPSSTKDVLKIYSDIQSKFRSS
jgi:hypothetical protein